MWHLFLLSIPLVVAREFTVSGLSGGAFMAVQMHFAYSADITAAGIIAGGPYYCVGTEPDPNYYYCSFFADQLSKDSMIDYIEAQAEKGNIDPTSNLKEAKVFLFTGTKDGLVVQGVGKLNYEIYKNYVANNNIVADFDFEAAHTWPTRNRGGGCLEVGMGNCGYDIAEKILTTAYGDLKPWVNMFHTNMIKFDQTAYFSTKHDIGLGDKGFIYVPTGCKDDPDECRVHMCFHGCVGNVDLAGEYFLRYNGINEWAEANDIVVIYPQTNSNSTSLLQEKGCWDYFGFYGENYALKNGVQMAAVYKMAQNLPNEAYEDSDSSESDDSAQGIVLSLLVILSLII